MSNYCTCDELDSGLCEYCRSGEIPVVDDNDWGSEVVYVDNYIDDKEFEDA